jgi:hypothetical protein
MEGKWRSRFVRYRVAGFLDEPRGNDEILENLAHRKSTSNPGH